MPNNILYATFNEPIPVGGTVSFDLNGIGYVEQYVVLRGGAGQVTADPTTDKTSDNYKTSLNLDHNSVLTAGRTGNTITIASKNLSHEFTNPASTHDVTFTFGENTEILVYGDSGNNFLINNDIIWQINSAADVVYYEVSFTNITNGNTTGVFRLYTKETSNVKEINLSPIIKSIFSYPEALNTYTDSAPTNNLNTISISITKNDSTNTYTVVRNFIRGGNRTNETNQSLSLTVTADFDTWLQPADKIPAWNGYPIAGYRLNINNAIRKVVQGLLPDGILDYQRVKSCHPLYVKFLNQKGGYSYWLFETEKESESNESLGGYIRNNRVDDLGNIANSNISAWAKVPSAYIGLIKDLIISPEIYIYRDGSFVRTLSGRNTIVEDDNKRAYQVTIKFEMQYRFDPAVVWYN